MTKENLIEYGLKLEHIISREDITSSTQVIEILKILRSLEVDPHLIRNARIIITINNLLILLLLDLYIYIITSYYYYYYII